MGGESRVTEKHLGEFQFPENCYQELKRSDDIFDRVAAAFLILRLKSRGEPVPGEEVDFAYNTMNEHRLSTMQKGGAF